MNFKTSLKGKERRTQLEIVDDFIIILREGKILKTPLFFKARVNTSTGEEILKSMIKWRMISYG